MMTREEVAEMIAYCKDRGITYKSKLIELGILKWKFFDSKARYAKEQAESQSACGEFIQLSASGAFVPMPSFCTFIKILQLGLTDGIDFIINQMPPHRY